MLSESSNCSENHHPTIFCSSKWLCLQLNLLELPIIILGYTCINGLKASPAVAELDTGYAIFFSCSGCSKSSDFETVVILFLDCFEGASENGQAIQHINLTFILFCVL